MDRIIATNMVLILGLLLSGCALVSDDADQQALVHNFRTDRVESSNLDAVFTMEKFSKPANKIGHPLSQTEAHQVLAAQIRDREKPHLHEQHDLLVYLHRGQGVLNTPHGKTELSPGDWTSISRRTPHQFINTGDGPARAVVIRTPPPEGRDYRELESIDGPD